MPLVESILTVWSTAVGTGSALKDLRDFLRETVKIEELFTQVVEDTFKQHLPRLRSLCLHGEPTFDANQFLSAIRTKELNTQRAADLQSELLPVLQAAVSAPTAMYDQSEFQPIYLSVLNSAVRGMWKKIAVSAPLAHQVLLTQSGTILNHQIDLETTLGHGLAEVKNNLHRHGTTIQALAAEIKSLADYSQSVWQQVYDRLLDSAPPPVHTIDQKPYLNPFLLAKAEDFNHNYDKLARLFQDSPEWSSIQRRTENVFIEGGRGTGKSMILRRLTAQASVAARRLQNRTVTLDDLTEDYFGVYVKLTRGYYEQFQEDEGVQAQTAQLLAQHELNVEIFDAFVETLRWLLRERVLLSLLHHTESLTQDLAALFDHSPAVHSLEELQGVTVRFEQNQILSYYRKRAFREAAEYAGSARPTVSFLRALSQVFRSRLFPDREVRLFLLIDEFESLLREQQVALNTVMKMRLPDVSFKIAVRRSGRKTSDTFTPGDPIQSPRDYGVVPLDYDVSCPHYSNLLEGIAVKRLQDAGYPGEKGIKAYLPGRTSSEEVNAADLQLELEALWRSGRRKAAGMDKEFVEKYTTAAVYRTLGRSGKRKEFSGFDQYVTLSSGVVSHFIELCKYAFYFALSDGLRLDQQAAIPFYLQTDAAYAVSQRLLESVEGNVPVVGSALATLVTDLGSVLRARLLKHPSEPEANRIVVVDFDSLSQEENRSLAQVIDAGVVWSVFHLEPVGEAYLPKSGARPPQAELIVNRIYCPALGISARARWRVQIRAAALRKLVDPHLRDVTYRKLMRTIGSNEALDPRQGTLFTVENS